MSAAKILNYTRHHVTDEDVEAVVRVLRSDHLTQGPAIEAFERALCEYTGAKYCVAVNSGTAALHLAYLAAGAKAVITSPLSFVATANAALMAGATVGFVDVNQVTGCIDPLPETCPPAGSVIVPVHYAGRAAPIPQLIGFGGEVPVIEDACHALGAMDYDGCSKVGSCAHSLATVFSFHPAKHITTGEGGAVMTNDASFAARVRLLRSHGRRPLRSHGRDSSYGHVMTSLGYNYRLSDIGAALGLSQLKRLDANVAARARHAFLYAINLEMEPPLPIQIPTGGCEWRPVANGYATPVLKHAWHLFPIRVRPYPKRDEVKAKLAARGILAQIHYPAIHLQPYYRDLLWLSEGKYPHAEAWAREELSLPLYPEMTEDDVLRVVSALKEALA